MQDLAICRVEDLGVIDYEQAYALQKQRVESLRNGGSQALLLCEHPPVLTMGRLTDETNQLISDDDLTRRGIRVHRIDRGGDITLHAPGQLVVYPVMDLSRRGRDLKRYLHQLEQVAIDLLGDFDIVASRFPGRTGVWTGNNKIVSVGVGVRKWITFHGFALNVNTDLELFGMIRPCGLDVLMTSIAQVKGRLVDMEAVKQSCIEHFFRIFYAEPSNS